MNEGRSEASGVVATLTHRLDRARGRTVPPGSDIAGTDHLEAVSGPGSCRDPLAAWVRHLAVLAPAERDAARIDQIRLLEDVKAACAAAQARVTAAFAASQRAAADVAGRVAGSAGGVTAGAPAGTVAGRPGGAGVSPTADLSGSRAATRGAAQQRNARRDAARRLAERSSAAQVALARRESPQRGGRLVGLAEALVGEMPHTLAALAAGVINEWRATLIVRETACLTSEGRSTVDAEIAGRLDGLGDARVAAMVKQIACRMDPASAARRATRAASDRRVTLRPAPDAMAYLTQLLPVSTAVACLATLRRAADTRADDDGRTRGQRMADEAAARLLGTAGVAAARPGPVESPGATDDPVAAVRAAYRLATTRTGPATTRSGPATAPAGTPEVPDGSDAAPAAGRAGPHRGSTGPDTADHAAHGGPGPHGFPRGAAVEINLVITDRALFAAGDDPALMGGHLPIPAPLARAMVTDLPPDASVWIRRLYTRPGTGELVSMDARRRAFSPTLRHLLFARDQGICRTPWCNAPARHADHIRPFAEGGATSIGNGQSLSEDCNYIRTAAGWSARHDPDRPGDVLITTPTGHVYPSPAIDLLPGHTRRPESAPTRHADETSPTRRVDETSPAPRGDETPPTRRGDGPPGRDQLAGSPHRVDVWHWQGPAVEIRLEGTAG